MVGSFTDGIWLVDFEFCAPSGERPEPLCMVAREFSSGETVRLWSDGLRARREAPFPTGPQALCVAYYASAELGCFLELGWPLPQRILDLCAEFKWATSGLKVPGGRTLLGALTYFGLVGIEAAEKETMRDLAMRGGPYDAAEQSALMDYCETDVVSLVKLLTAMLPQLDRPRALLRGRYMAAAARMEHCGVPIDVSTLGELRENWASIQTGLIARIDQGFGVYEGRCFKADRFAAYLRRGNIPWPLLESGKLAMDDATFRQMSKAFPCVAPLRELRHSLAELRLEALAVGRDGRNRCLLGAFGSKTGRNQPSNSQFIFGPSVWLRGLIKPEPDMAVAYIDFEQQEFGIAAALSGDATMAAAYASGDPYLAFAKQAGAVPEDANAESHPTERALYKQCVLATQYGMGEKTFAERLGQPECLARELLRKHRETYSRYWTWSDAAVNHAMLFNRLHTVLGWQVRVGQESNPRSLQNFPMQANGAEILRLACSLATEEGIRVCAPVHDALLIEAPADEIDAVVSRTQALMVRAGEVVLSGFQLRTKAEAVVRFPDRYMDEKRGRQMWDVVTGILAEQLSVRMGPGIDGTFVLDSV